MIFDENCFKNNGKHWNWEYMAKNIYKTDVSTAKKLHGKITMEQAKVLMEINPTESAEPLTQKLLAPHIEPSNEFDNYKSYRVVNARLAEGMFSIKHKKTVNGKIQVFVEIKSGLHHLFAEPIEGRFPLDHLYELNDKKVVKAVPDMDILTPAIAETLVTLPKCYFEPEINYNVIQLHVMVKHGVVIPRLANLKPIFMQSKNLH